MTQLVTISNASGGAKDDDTDDDNSDDAGVKLEPMKGDSNIRDAVSAIDAPTHRSKSARTRHGHGRATVPSTLR